MRFFHREKVALIVPAGRALHPDLDGSEFRQGRMIPWRYEAVASIVPKIQLVTQRNPLIIVTGDGAPKVGLPHGEFNQQAIDYLVGTEFENLVEARNFGPGMQDMNTRGDLRAARRIILSASIDKVVIVTCWYHLPRSMAVMRDELRSARRIAISGFPVWRDLHYGFSRWRDLRRGEFRGTLDALLGHEQCSRRNFERNHH